MKTARKISFQEAWNSSIVFFVDEALEKEIEAEVEKLLETERSHQIHRAKTQDLTRMLNETENALDVVLKDLELSEEKFLRIISLLRKLGRIAGDFDKEWSINKIKSKILQEPDFARLIGELLLDGVRDKDLQRYVPRYYLESLDYRNVPSTSETALRRRYKRMLIGTYGARKGHTVEEQIRQELATIEANHGIGYGKGRSRIVETDIDFAIPNIDDPWVIIMSSFQETTSSGQITKVREMISA